jgi:predicted dienelactone hydrolase
VIAAPALGHAFVGTALSHVIAPVQLWKAAEDRIAPSGSSLEPIKTALPTPPETHLVPGAGHFAFLAPCSPALAAQAPEICQDPSGFDRAAFHSAFNPALITFFQRALAAR